MIHPSLGSGWITTGLAFISKGIVYVILFLLLLVLY